MRRVISVWLPMFACERLKAPETPPGAPWAVTVAERGARRVAAADRAAAQAGIRPGMPLTDARALVPDLHSRPADPAGLHRDITRLAAWCRRYTPWCAVDGSAPEDDPRPWGLWLDVTGCAHLFGGERPLLDDLGRRLAEAGLTARAAVADTPGAAWAVARFGNAGTTVIPAGHPRAALASLPAAALRLPGDAVAALADLGLRRIGDLAGVPRAPLAGRFGAVVGRRLDEAFGGRPEPLAPNREAAPLRTRLSFAEPIGRTQDVERALDHLLADLQPLLEARGLGARRLRLRLDRIDGRPLSVAVGTGRPMRDPAHLRRLFLDGRRLDGLDSGFGIESAILDVLCADPLAPEQTDRIGGRSARWADDLARLVDRLGARLGPGRTLRLAPAPHHLPERADRVLPPLPPAESASPNQGDPRSMSSTVPTPRPLRLFPQPEPIEAVARLPDSPPALIRRRGRVRRVARAEGPERIGPEWWRDDPRLSPPETQAQRTRDYYRIETEDGRRFWVYREGLPRPGVAPRWYLHGEFP